MNLPNRNPTAIKVGESVLGEPTPAQLPIVPKFPKFGIRLFPPAQYS